MDAERRDEGKELHRDKERGRNERPQWGKAEGGTSDAITANCQGRGGQLNSLGSVPAVARSSLPVPRTW